MRKPSSIPDVHNIFTDPGNRKKSLFTPRFDGTKITLVESGTIDIQDEINSYAPYSDLRYMLSRLKVGDSSVFKSQPALYGDFTSIPDNAVDAVNLLHDVERRFATLSEDERSACNNDWRVYLANLFNNQPVTPAVDAVSDVTKEVIKEEIHES